MFSDEELATVALVLDQEQEDPAKKKSSKSATVIKAASIEEALNIAGCGWYTYFVVLAGGLNLMASNWTIVHLCFIVPATDCDLQLTVQQKGILTTMVFTGMMFTTHLFGFISDEYGRRLTAMLCSFVCGFLNLLMAFAPGYVSLSVIVFFSGVVNAGIAMPSYILIGECVPMKIRSLSMNLAGTAGALASFILPGLGLVLVPLEFKWDLFGLLTFNSWRMMVLISVLPSFLSAISLYFLKESPKFLLAKGKSEEALAVLKLMYAVNNGCSERQFNIESVIEDPDEIVNISDANKGALFRFWAQTEILFKKPLLILTLALSILQAGVVGACNAIFFMLPQIATQMINFMNANPDTSATVCQIVNLPTFDSFDLNPSEIEDSLIISENGVCKTQVPVDTFYISLVIGGVQLVSYSINGKLTQWFGCKTLLVVYLALSIGFALVLEFVTDIWASITIQAVIALTLSAAIPITVILSVEYFPTNVRSTASCICALAGRILSSGATVLMAALQVDYCEVSYYLFSAFVAGICIVALLLPPAPNEKKDESKV